MTKYILVHFSEHSVQLKCDNMCNRSKSYNRSMQTLKQVSEQRLTSQNMSTQNMSLLGHRTLGFDIETSGLNDPADSI